MAARTIDPDAPYLPKFAQEVELIQNWTGVANKYLTNTGNGNMKEAIALLELGIPLNMVAALSLLGDTNKGKVVRKTRLHAEHLYNTQEAAHHEKTKKSLEDHYSLLQPDPKRFKDPELTLSYQMAIVALLLITMREEAHSKEFENVKGQHSRDMGVLICIMFEAFLDHRDGAHRGLFVDKFGLPSTPPSPTSPPPVSNSELPFIPRVVLYLAEKRSWTKVAIWFLEHSRLFSQIRLLDLNSHKTRKINHELLNAENEELLLEIRDITAQAIDKLDASGDSRFDESKVAQGKTLATRLAWLAVGLVGQRMKSTPADFPEHKNIRFNLFIVISLTYEALVGYSVKNSYFQRKLLTESKRTRAEIDTEPTTANAHREDQPSKKRKKRTSKKHGDNTPEQVQKRTENDTLEAGDTHLKEFDSDIESSLFVPQTGDAELPVAASYDATSEAFDKALEEGQKKSVFNERSAGPSNPPLAISNVPALPTIHAPAPVSSGPWRLRSRAMRPILGQTQYDELKTDFDVIAQTYKALEPKRGTLEKAKEIAALQSSVDELQSEVEVLSSVVEEACEENFQLKARVKELEKQAQEGKSRRSAA